MAASIVALMGSMPAFASAGVEANQVQNEVIPMKKSADGVNCPQLDFSHKIVEKALSVNDRPENFTASVNSIIWDVNAENKNLLRGIHSSRDNTRKSVELMSAYPKVGCSYAIAQDGKNITLFMKIKPIVDEARRKAEHIKMVRGIVEKIKAAGVVSYDDLMNIINEVMPKPR